jgi:hypothetical protein
MENVNANKIRERLNETLEQYGMTLMFISKSLGWKYHNLNKFKNGHINMSAKRQKMLSEFLDKFDNDVVKKKVPIIN